MTIHPEQLPHYFKALSPEGLKSLMMSNNLKKGKYYRYEVMFANGFWYAWYEEIVDEVELSKYANIDRRKGQRSQEV